MHYPPNQPYGQPPGVPIDTEIQRIQLQIEQYRIQLSQINADMSATRAHYSQHHVHGGGKLGHFVRGAQRSGKDHALASMQPHKEQLQRQKLALEQQLIHLKMLKSQGVTVVQSSNATLPSGRSGSFGLMNLLYLLFIGWWLGFYWVLIAAVLYVIPAMRNTAQWMFARTRKVFLL